MECGSRRELILVQVWPFYHPRLFIMKVKLVKLKTTLSFTYFCILLDSLIFYKTSHTVFIHVLFLFGMDLQLNAVGQMHSVFFASLLTKLASSWKKNPVSNMLQWLISSHNKLLIAEVTSSSRILNDEGFTETKRNNFQFKFTFTSIANHKHGCAAWRAARQEVNSDL